MLLLAGGMANAQPAPSVVKDTIFARKILMDTIDSHMDAIDWMFAARKPLDLAKAVEHAGSISAMLLAFPHLFPPETNEWQPDAKRDPGRDTYAAPALWSNFAEFYRQAAAASQLALKASQAKRSAEFKAQVESLRAACEGCHAAFVKTGE